MKKIYKISLFIGAMTLIFTIGNFHFAQGKGYFFEKDNKFYIFDNLVIGNPITGSGYLVVEENLSAIKGLDGDVLVGKNFIMDPTSKVNFCKDLGGANRDCNKKVMEWASEGLNVIDPAFYQMQTQTAEALNNTNLNFIAGAGKNISAASAVKLNGCFSNYGSDCLSGEMRTKKLYLDNIAALNSKTLSGVDKITLNPGNLFFTKLDLGSLANQNLCWNAAGGMTGGNPVPCNSSTATGGHNSAWDIGIYPGGYYAGGSVAICCNFY